MKFEKITDVKIKIILSLKDIESLNISNKNILNDSEYSNKLLESMLNKAQQEIGFEAGDSQLLVETLISSEQEYIFTITKLSDQIVLEDTSKDSFIYKFENFDNFIALCTFLNNLSDLNLKNFSKNFSLILLNNTYYLYTFEVKTYSALLDYMRSIFSEFATPISNIYLDGLLNEYGKVIYKNDAIINCIFNFI